jgi:hypothetical protein
MSASKRPTVEYPRRSGRIWELGRVTVTSDGFAMAHGTCEDGDSHSFFLGTARDCPPAVMAGALDCYGKPWKRD